MTQRSTMSSLFQFFTLRECERTREKMFSMGLVLRSVRLSDSGTERR